MLQADVDRKKMVDKMNQGPDYGLFGLPVKNMITNCTPQLANIKAAIEGKEVFEIVPLNPLLPPNRMKRFRLLQDIKSSGIGMPATIYSGMRTGHLESLHFIWTKPAGEEDPARQLQAVEEARKLIPVYHDKEVKRLFHDVANQLKIKPMHSRALYRIATEDATASDNNAQKEVDARVVSFIQREDEEVVMDLREIHRQPTIYDEFFEAAKVYIESKVEVAVDDRRQCQITHLALAMSAADLFRCVAPVVIMLLENIIASLSH